MQLPAKAHYATVAMLELAANQDQSAPLTLRWIADEHGIPLPFLTQIVQHLRCAGLVLSSRGPSGGYRLSRPAANISLIEIVEAVSHRTPSCAKKCESRANQVVEQVWVELEKHSDDKLRSIMLNELVQQTELLEEAMFHI